jgi:hypothetical protein
VPVKLKTHTVYDKHYGKFGVFCVALCNGMDRFTIRVRSPAKYLSLNATETPTYTINKVARSMQMNLIKEIKKE